VRGAGAARVRGEGPARQPRPLDRTLALLDSFLRGAASVVERDNALGRRTGLLVETW
jgi:hypothetical protein